MIKQSEFHSILKAVAHSAGTVGYRENLNAILFEFSGDQIKLVSTDGHRISIAILKVKTGVAVLLISITDIKEILGIFKYNQDKRVTIVNQDNKLVVSNGKATLVLDNMELDYPDYKNVIPNDMNGSAGIVRLNARYLTEMTAACKNIMRSGSDIDVITRDELEVMTFLPLLSDDLENVQSFETHMMPIRRTE